jgi:hypothetical protein
MLHMIMLLMPMLIMGMLLMPMLVTLRHLACDSKGGFNEFLIRDFQAKTGSILTRDN